MKSLAKQWQKLPHPVRWLIAATVGFTLLILGLIFLVLPGPGIPLILIGLTILGSEFAWAEYLLSKTKVQAQKIGRKLRRNG